MSDADEGLSPTGQMAVEANVPDWLQRTKRLHFVLVAVGLVVGAGGLLGGPVVALNASMVFFALAFGFLGVVEIAFPEACHHIGWGGTTGRIGLTGGEWRLTVSPRGERPEREDVIIVRIQGVTYLIVAFASLWFAGLRNLVA